MDQNLWSRRTNSSKLSLSTPGPANGAGPNDASGRNASFGRPVTSSHGKSNPFSTTPGLTSPTSASGANNAFGLGSGVFASFGSAKTPKTPGNPFELAMGGVQHTIGDKLGREEPVGTSTAGFEHLPAAAKGANPASAAPAPAAPIAVKHLYQGVSPTRVQWEFWCRPPVNKAYGQIDYDKTIHPIATIGSVSEFLAIKKHLRHPSFFTKKEHLPFEYHLFQKGIRPIWEDEENRHGGKWVLRLRKGVADRYWEAINYALIGDQFFEAGDGEVCGAAISIRAGEDILSVWVRSTGRKVLKVRDAMKKCLECPANTKFEWRDHDSSIQQRAALDESRRNNQQQGDKRSAKQAE